MPEIIVRTIEHTHFELDVSIQPTRALFPSGSHWDAFALFLLQAFSLAAFNRDLWDVEQQAASAFVAISALIELQKCIEAQTRVASQQPHEANPTLLESSLIFLLGFYICLVLFACVLSYLQYFVIRNYFQRLKVFGGLVSSCWVQNLLLLTLVGPLYENATLFNTYVQPAKHKQTWNNHTRSSNDPAWLPQCTASKARIDHPGCARCLGILQAQHILLCIESNLSFPKSPLWLWAKTRVTMVTLLCWKQKFWNHTHR